MAAKFKVLAQRPDTEFTPDGRLVDAMAVTYEVPGVGVFTHRFLATEWHPETVAAKLDELADRAKSIAEL